MFKLQIMVFMQNFPFLEISNFLRIFMLFLYFVFLSWLSFQPVFFFFKTFYFFINFWPCCIFVAVLAFSSCSEQGAALHCSVRASHCRGLSCYRAQAHRLSCSMACGIFPEQGPNPWLLPWQAGSSPLSHRGSPSNLYFKNTFISKSHRFYYQNFFLG